MEKPGVSGSAIEFPGHDGAAEHDGQHYWFPEVGAQVDEKFGRKPPTAGGAADADGRQQCVRHRRVGNDLAGQR